MVVRTKKALARRAARTHTKELAATRARKSIVNLDKGDGPVCMYRRGTPKAGGQLARGGRWSGREGRRKIVTRPGPCAPRVSLSRCTSFIRLPPTAHARPVPGPARRYMPRACGRRTGVGVQRGWRGQRDNEAADFQHSETGSVVLQSGAVRWRWRARGTG